MTLQIHFFLIIVSASPDWGILPDTNSDQTIPRVEADVEPQNWTNNSASDAEPAPAPLIERLAAGRPTNFPSTAVWLKSGILRNLRGALASLVAAWLYVPGALAIAAMAAIMIGGFGYFFTFLTGEQALPAPIRDLPLIGDAAENLLFQSNGVMAGLLGVILGGAIGFVGGILWIFISPFEESMLDGIATVLGSFAMGVLIGLGYTTYRVVFERQILHVNGARRLSRREASFILPIVAEAAARLKLPNHPFILIDDTREPNAFAYTRHIVVNQGLLDEFNYDPEPIAAVLAHELVHWRNGDPLSAVFVRGVALPLYLLQAGGGWLRDRTRNSVLRFFAWTVFWPIFVTVQYFVVPMQAADSRRAEYRADEGAVLAGHRAGMRRVLTYFRCSFEGGRNGWVSAVCASHPPNELRLERLEEPGGDYRLPDKDSPALPLPVLLTNAMD